eukprot:15437726-Alexandrium_andersonii.AAC.1
MAPSSGLFVLAANKPCRPRLRSCSAPARRRARAGRPSGPASAASTAAPSTLARSTPERRAPPRLGRPSGSSAALATTTCFRPGPQRTAFAAPTAWGYGHELYPPESWKKGCAEHRG